MAGMSKFGSIQSMIMEILGSGSDVTMAFLMSGKSTRALFRNYRTLRSSRTAQKIRQSVAALEKRRLVNMREKNGESHIILTDEGKRRLLKYDLDHMHLARQKNWDGKWHIVIFDIPEKYGKARRALSWKIRQMGAFSMQKSVFIYPFFWRDEIDFVTEFFHVSPYVRYIEAFQVEGEKDLCRHFDLPPLKDG